MPKFEQFALILFTLRDYLKTREDALKTFDKIAEIGYKTVQVSGMPKDILSEEEIVKELKDRGISICATHEGPDEILNDTEAVIERLKKLGVRYTAYPFPKDVDLTSPAAVDDLAHRLDVAGEKFAQHELTLTYHNHACEFYRLNGSTVLDRLYHSTKPRHLQAEIDTFWVQRGGASPLAWVQKCAGRMPLLHLKDFRVLTDNTIEFAEIGSGNIDFKPIVKEAEAGGCEYFIVEQDTCNGDPFDSIAQSLSYIREHLCDH